MATTNNPLVTITWRDDKIPMDTPVTIHDVVMRSAVMVKARKHLAVDRGARSAMSAAHALVRHIKYLSIQAARRGETLQLSTTNQTDAPPAWDRYVGLGLLVRALSGNTIMWSVQITSSGAPIIIHVRPGRTDRRVYISSRRADVIIRRATAQPYVLPEAQS